MSAPPEAVERRGPAESADADPDLDAPDASAGALARAGAAVGWRGMGVLGGKLVALARTLVLARLLAPADFGLFAIALVPLEFLLGLTDVGMAPALVQRVEVARRDYDVAWTVGVLRGALIGVVLAAGAPVFAAACGDPRATVFVRALAIRPVLVAVASVRVAELERRLRYRALVGIDLAASVLGTAVALGFALSRGHWALVAGNLSTVVVGTVASYVYAPYRPRFVVDPGRARELLRFGRWVLAGGIVGMIGEATLRAVIARALGTDALGRYALATTLATTPRDLTRPTIKTVAFAVHARLQTDDREAGRAYRASIVALCAVLLPAYAALVVLAPRLTALFGPAWRGTAVVVQLLAAMAALSLLYDATSPLLQGRGRPQTVVALYALASVTTVALVWPLAHAAGIAGAALARLGAELVVWVGCVQFARRALDRPFQGLFRPLGAIAAAALAGACAAAVVVRPVPGMAGLVAGGVGALAVTGLTFALLDRRLRLGVVDTLVAAVRPRLRSRPAAPAEPAGE
ncbi:hypothetical protein tb265_15510 [Gemmatimonadetes bacterium T265]|nr:hypothetical protein tb265_15510 [Gemmatimonadetes bacterium T265]